MTAMKPVLDLVVDANVVLILAFCIWRLAQAALVRSPLRFDFRLQLNLLRCVLLFVVLSPLLSLGAVSLSQTLWPKAPITVSDLAVASYLRGDIAMPAIQFEALLNTRNRIFEMILAGDLPWLTVALVALICGSAVLMARTILAMSRVHSVVTQSFVWRRTAATDIRLSDTVAVPFVARGLWRYHVVLPSHLLTRPADLRIVLAHEFEHIRQNDVEWELAFELLRPFLYLNPAFLLWKQAFNRIRELNCDQAVLTSTQVSPRDYARCLLTFVGRGGDTRTVEILNVAFIRTGSSTARRALEDRFLALRHKTKSRDNGLVFWALALVFVFGITASAASVRNPGDWSQDRLTLSMVVNLERYNATNAGF